ncbi:MAG TPA: DUF362 domain-containing protein [Myxococcales bacterium]|nr:DUF362 domain-containing protein [Myxococcales bacterium]
MPDIKPSTSAPAQQPPITHADAQRLLSEAESGHLQPEQARALQKQVSSAPADAFKSPGLKERLEGVLKKVAEGATSVGMMQFGWTRELLEGTASVFRGRGTIRGEVPEAVKALNKTGVSPAGVVSVDPAQVKLADGTVDKAAERAKVYAAQKQAIDSIGGFDFLSKPPEGKATNEHTVLIKPGMNWGVMGYPSCTSSESTYATVKQTLEEADKRGATVHVVVGDESGIECKALGASTMGNFEHAGTLDGAVRAGLERAAAKEKAGDAGFKGAQAILDGLKDGKGHERMVMLTDKDAIAMAGKAGVKVVGFEDGDYVRVPVPDIAPGRPGNKHFPDGVLIPKIAAEADDIINVPKPPGRHALMGCAGLSGAAKNSIGLLAGSDRVPLLHGPLDRVPGLNDGSHGPTWMAEFKQIGDQLNDPNLSRADKMELLKKLSGDAHWDLNNEHGPNMMLHEKIAELTSVFAPKQRFTVADMRRTMSSVGPDLGDTMDIGKVIATKDAYTTDIIANSLMKHGYDSMGVDERTSAKLHLPSWLKETADWFKVAVPGGDTPSEYFYGKTWLEDGATAFDTLQIRAGMAYGIAPTGVEGIKLQTALRPGETKEDVLERFATPK